MKSLLFSWNILAMGCTNQLLKSSSTFSTCALFLILNWVLQWSLPSYNINQLTLMVFLAQRENPSNNHLKCGSGEDIHLNVYVVPDNAPILYWLPILPYQAACVTLSWSGEGYHRFINHVYYSDFLQFLW